jgi:poly-gamma-glutamate biosynthesis protein PgsC/CapC
MIAINLLAVAIGIGLLFTLLLTEAFSLAAGGLVVPGYMALQVMQPWRMGLTLIAAYLTYLSVHALAGFLVVYGRRQTALTILIGFLIGSAIDISLGGVATYQRSTNPELIADPENYAYLELTVIGYIIPGLIAIWFARQGVIRTLVGLFLCVVLTRLTLIVIIPDVLASYEAEYNLYRPDWDTVLQGVQE